MRDRNARARGRDPRDSGAHSGDRERIREDLRLFERYQRTGDEAACEELIRRFLPLARQLARRYERPDEPLDDLVQVASVGLVKAVQRFDPTRGIAFSSFAVPTILGELKRYFRDSAWAVHVPRAMQERALEVNRAVTELSRALGRSPTPAEVAEFTDLTPEEVLEAMEAATAYDSVPLEIPRQGGDGEGESAAEWLGADDEGYALAEYSATLAPQLRALPKRDRLVLYLRFVEDLTQSEIAERIGVSQMHVSRLIRRALERLRNDLDA
ncbi:MAG TPA: SigB/SigF/SigG family RNA polymerase sigma factor [Thermoleophilaceae bacterium]|nr:SigB/SigF/SigG family RNA polymerase sigma factor [Thermoleophilaceae bacterium]